MHFPGEGAEDIEFTFRRSDNRPMPPGSRADNNVLYLVNVDEAATGEYACVGQDRISGMIRFTIYTTIEVIGESSFPQCDSVLFSFTWIWRHFNFSSHSVFTCLLLL